MADARHRSRHRSVQRRSLTPTQVLIPLVVVLLLAGGGFLANSLFFADDGDEGDCPDALVLTVRTGPTLTAPLSQIAAAYNDQRRIAMGRCVVAKIETVDSGQTATAIAAGWPSDQYGAAPDVWVPESASWLALAATGVDSGRLLGDGAAGDAAAGQVIASTPVVLAMPRVMAEALGWPDRQLSWADLRANENSSTFWSERGHPEWGEFKIGFANPQNSSSGLAAVVNVVASSVGTPASQLSPQNFSGDLTTKGAILTFERGADLIADSDTDLVASYVSWGEDAPARMSALVLPEAMVYLANTGTRPAGEDGGEAGDDASAGTPPAAVPLAASYPTDGLVVDEARYVPLGLPPDSERAAAAADLLAELTGPAGQAVLADFGFRSPGRDNPKLDHAAGLVPTLRSEPGGQPNGLVVDAVRRTFLGIHQRGNTLVVIDTSGSMDLPVPDSGGRTRLQIAIDAASTAIPLFASESNVGLWQLSTGRDGTTDYRELVPLGRLDEPIGSVSRRQALLDAVADLTAAGGTGLYDTTLAAFREVSDRYLEDQPNQVVIITDGENDDPTSITLPELVETLKAEYDPQRPVQIITIGYGTDVDPDALRQISEATGARSYPAQDPNTIFQVMLSALTER